MLAQPAWKGNNRSVSTVSAKKALTAHGMFTALGYVQSQRCPWGSAELL